MTRRADPRQPRTRLSPEVRRDLLLDAASDVFGAVGFADARMADIATAADVAKGLLYKHFASKEELYQAVLARQAQGFEQRVEARLATTVHQAAPHNQQELVTFGLHTWIDQIYDDLNQGRIPRPPDHDLLDGYLNRIRATAARHVQTLMPDANPDHIRLLAAAVIGAAVAAGRVWQDHPGTVTAPELRTLAEHLVAATLDAFIATAKPPETTIDTR